MKIVDKIKSLIAGLPSWATENDGKIFVNADKAYPLYLSKLGVTEIDQYWLEVARRCFTEDLLKAAGKPIHLVIMPGDGRWALRNFPVGAGELAGALGFRLHYEKLA